MLGLEKLAKKEDEEKKQSKSAPMLQEMGLLRMAKNKAESRKKGSESSEKTAEKDEKKKKPFVGTGAGAGALGGLGLSKLKAHRDVNPVMTRKVTIPKELQDKIPKNLQGAKLDDGSRILKIKRSGRNPGKYQDMIGKFKHGKSRNKYMLGGALLGGLGKYLYDKAQSNSSEKKASMDMGMEGNLMGIGRVKAQKKEKKKEQEQEKKAHALGLARTK